MRYDRRGDSSSQSVRAAGAGARTELGGPGSGALDGEPRLAARLTQTIKTAEARSRHLGACREGHFCTRPETRRRGKIKRERTRKGGNRENPPGTRQTDPHVGQSALRLAAGPIFGKNESRVLGFGRGPRPSPFPAQRPMCGTRSWSPRTQAKTRGWGWGVGGLRPHSDAEAPAPPTVSKSCARRRAVRARAAHVGDEANPDFAEAGGRGRVTATGWHGRAPSDGRRGSPGRGR